MLVKGTDSKSQIRERNQQTKAMRSREFLLDWRGYKPES